MTRTIVLTILFVFLLSSCGKHEPSAEELKTIYLQDIFSRGSKKFDDEKYRQEYANAISLHKITACQPETAPSEYLLCPIKLTLQLSGSPPEAHQLSIYIVMQVRHTDAGWVSDNE
ncbi:MAG: hypothetical protein Q4B82_08535 [Alysiella sp.]|uniref:hypothetical protein n=1 Tax=Alysiella sp. TaxID=1872483 RepID=UPI0026DC681D|nr:hypothetical protein [Alysiella sp.]MDO4434608.1 hypothetical protein [Alysiella sp.]